MDIAIVPITDGLNTRFDLALDGPDLAVDETLRTPVIISLFSDRLAADDDVIPDGTGDRRGWWGDTPIDNSGEDPSLQLIGSRLWLLDRGKAQPDSAALAETYAAEGLQWLVSDGVAAAIAETAAIIALGAMSLTVNIARQKTAGGKPDARFDFIWTSTIGG